MQLRQGSENGVFRCGRMMVSFTYEEEVLIREEDSYNAKGMLMALVQLPEWSATVPLGAKFRLRSRAKFRLTVQGEVQVDGPRRSSG